jgi:3-isopropylmalate/(R)-2-methylmalate dehydratase small subunit
VDELSLIRGKAWVIGDNVDTDQIIQGRYLTLLDYGEMAKHALEIPRPDFASGVKKGDILVAGRNLGGGSSREEALMVLKKLGIGCIVAESFARLFYRNGFNVGLPLLAIPDVTKVVKEGMKLEIRLRDGEMILVETRECLRGKPLPEFMMRMLTAGGAVALYRESQKR